MRTLFLFIFCAGIFTFSYPLITSAQIGSGSLTSDLSIQLDERYPSPNTTIEASLSGHTIEGVRWFLNGFEISDRPGLRSLSIPTGEAGVVQELEIRREGELLTRHTFRPIHIDIGVDADTYTPPHYIGASVPTAGAAVRLTALVTEHANISDPSNYLYHWRINGQTFGGGPLTTHQIHATVPNARNMFVELRIIQPEVGTIGELSKTIPVKRSEVLFYELHELYGLLPYTLSSLNQESQNRDILAAPYNAPLSGIQTENITWRVDGRNADSLPNQPLLINPSTLTTGRGSSISFRLFDLSTLHNASAEIRTTN